MADNFKFAQLQPFSLNGSGAIAGATTIVLKSFKTIDGVSLAMTDFGSVGFGTIEPGNGTSEEQISFTGVSQNANGTATLTGVSTVLFLSPYTKSSGTAKTHAGSTVFIISNTSGFYDELTSKDDDETINGLWTFVQYPQISNSAVFPTLNEQFATKAYVDSVAIAGAPKATDIVYGITRLSVAAVSPTAPIAVGDNDPRVPTQGENDALVGNNTDIAVGSGNKFVTQTGLIHNAETFAVDASGSTTAYSAVLSPVVTSLTNGMVVKVKIVSANTTTTPTLNVNSLGAKTIVKYTNTALAVGDIGANSYNTFIYDTTNTVWVLQSPIAQVPAPARLYSNSSVASSTSSTTQTITHNLTTTPKRILLNGYLGLRVETNMGVGSSNGTWDGGGQSSSSIVINSGGTNSTSTSSAAAIVLKGFDGVGVQTLSGVVGNVGATTFDIVWTFTSGGSSALAASINWSAEN